MHGIRLSTEWINLSLWSSPYLPTVDLYVTLHTAPNYQRVYSWRADAHPDQRSHPCRHVRSPKQRNLSTRLGLSATERVYGMVQYEYQQSGTEGLYCAALWSVPTDDGDIRADESTRFHQKMGLWFAGLLCLFYAVDKITALHSVLPVSYRQMLLSNWMLWCIPIIPIMYGFFRVPYQIRYWFILGCLLLASSFAIDRWSVYITGRYSGHHMIGALMGDAEGLMEMLGAVLVIHGMLVYRAGGQVGRKAGGQKGKANSRKGIDAKTLFRA